MGIQLSEKHGVNPSLPVCFWCGQETGEVAMLGKLRGDEEAPKRMLLSYNPCPSCKEAMAQGVVLVEAVRTPNGNPELQPGVYPTGTWAVVKAEAAEQVFGPVFYDSIREGRKALLEPETWDALGLPRENRDNREVKNAEAG